MLDLVFMNFIAHNIKKGTKSHCIRFCLIPTKGIVCFLLSFLDIACYIIRLFFTLTVDFLLG